MSLYAKTSILKAFTIIATIYSAVVVLPKKLGAAFGVGDRVILECCGTASILWDKHYAPAPGT
jgi:hypothetical protein